MAARLNRFRRVGVVLALGLAMLASLHGCREAPAGPRDPGALDLDALFLPATAAEIAAVEAQWAARDVSAREIRDEATAVVLMAGGLGTARVFSHLVDGHRHFGATLVPLGAAAGSLPVIVFAHGGDAGVSVQDVGFVLLLLGDRLRNFVYVIPSFRSEPLILGGSTFLSAGPPSPWDRDVDDTLALLDVALQRIPEADPQRIGALGYSRGATVAMLMAIRDPRIRLLSQLAGPTDFFDPWVRGIIEDALRDQPRPLPGFTAMNQQFIQPLRAGTLSPAQFRLELVRRSPTLWAARLPPTQLHHGTADDVVPVRQAEALIARLQALPRAALGDEFYLYPGAGHNLLELRELDSRVVSFLTRLR